ncbi:MAG: hypothetical protein ACOCRK_11835 [bacterium]
MRELSDGEILNLSNLLKMEKDGLAATRAMQTLITDEQLQRQADSAIMAAENRIKGMQQFISENNIINQRR